jgi:peptidoglycan-associated lipoprotein
MKWLLRTSLFLVLAAGLALAGCAKRTVQAPPVPAPAPPSNTGGTPTPPPAPPPETSTPAPGSDAIIAQLQPAFFDYDSYSLNEQARAALDADARVLRDNPTVNVTVEGHCDERGTPEYNLALGERRATAARDYLVAAGIDAGRMRVISYGKERPFATGSDEASYAQNRRAHFSAR